MNSGFLFYRLVKLFLIALISILFCTTASSQQFIKKKVTKQIIGLIKWQTQGTCECTYGDCRKELSKIVFGDNCQHSFEGKFEKGRPIEGKYTWDNGLSWYQGKLQDGISHDRTGNAKMKRVDGTLIEGEFRNGTVAGKAKITYPDGAVEEGVFDDNSKLNSTGTYTWSPYSSYAGSFYTGNFRDSRFSGFGELVLKYDSSKRDPENKGGDNDRCFIEWPYTSTDNRYVGEFADCNFSGYGVFYSYDGNILKSGFWEADGIVRLMPEAEVIQLLNQKYGLQLKPKSEELEKVKAEDNREAAKRIQEEIENILFNMDSTSNAEDIQSEVEVKEEPNEFGRPEKKLTVNWEIDTTRAIIEEGVVGNYPSGSYLFEEATNVQALLEAIHRSIIESNQLNQYISDAERIQVSILATADSPKPNQLYKGEYGDDISGDYYTVTSGNVSDIGPLSQMRSLRKNTRIRSNNTMAYIRAYGAKNYMTTKIFELPSESSGRILYNLKTQEFKEEAGPEFRKLSIQMEIRLPKKPKTTPGTVKDTIEYYDNIPTGQKASRSMAIIISNYAYEAPFFAELPTGQNDGNLLETYVKKSLGIDNVLVLENRNTTQLQNFFLRTLPDIIQPNTDQLIVYISAHGMQTGKDQDQPIILGTDAQYSENGILVDSIYSALSSLENRYQSALLLFDVCYSSTGKGVIIRPKKSNWSKKMVVIHANTEGKSFLYEAKNLSLFTYYFCHSIYERRLERELSIRTLFEDLKANIPTKALQLNPNWIQVPRIQPAENETENQLLDKVIVRYQVGN